MLQQNFSQAYTNQDYTAQRQNVERKSAIGEVDCFPDYEAADEKSENSWHHRRRNDMTRHQLLSGPWCMLTSPGLQTTNPCQVEKTHIAAQVSYPFVRLSH